MAERSTTRLTAAIIDKRKKRGSRMGPVFSWVKDLRNGMRRAVLEVGKGLYRMGVF